MTGVFNHLALMLTLLMHREHGSSVSSTIVSTVFKFALFSVQKIAPTQINVKHRLLRGRIHCTMLKDSVEKVSGCGCGCLSQKRGEGC